MKQPVIPPFSRNDRSTNKKKLAAFTSNQFLLLTKIFIIYITLF